MVKNTTFVAFALVALVSTSASQAWTYTDYIPSACNVSGYALKGAGLALVASTAYVALRSSVPVNEIKRASKDSSFLSKAKDIFMNDILGQDDKDLGYIQRKTVDEDGNEVVVLDKNHIPATGLVGTLLSKSKKITRALGVAGITTMALVAARILNKDILDNLSFVRETSKLANA